MPELGDVVANYAIGGVVLLPVLVWLVQAIKEAFRVDRNWVPLLTGLVALPLVAVSVLPDPYRSVIITAFGLSAAANAFVKFTTDKKNT